MAKSADELDALYEKYATNQLTPEEKAAFDAEVKAGTIYLPKALTTVPTEEIPSEPVQVELRFSPGEQANVKEEVPSELKHNPGEQAPATTTGYASEGFSPVGVSDETGSVTRTERSPGGPDPTVGIDIASPVDAAWDKLIDIASPQSPNPDYEALPDLFRMPELRPTSWDGFKSLIGSIAAGRDEIKKILKSQYPDMKIEEEGDYMLAHSKDGQKYAWKKGLRGTDIARGVAVALPMALASAYAGPVMGATRVGAPLVRGAAQIASKLPGVVTGPVGKAAGVGAAQTLALESGKKWAGGGDVNWPNIAVGGALNAVPAMASATKRGLSNWVKGSPPLAPVLDEFGENVVMAQQGDDAAKRAAVASVSPEQEMVDALKRQNMLSDAGPEIVAGNKAVAETVNTLQSTSTELKALNEANLLAMSVKAGKALEKLGGTTSPKQLSFQSQMLKRDMTMYRKSLRIKSAAAHKAVDEGIPPLTSVNAEALGDLIKTARARLKPNEPLPPLLEEMSQLLPKEVSLSAPPKTLANVATGAPPTPTAKEYPSFEYFNRKLREVGAETISKTPFPGRDQALALDVYNAMKADKLVVADQFGQGAKLNAANALTQLQKKAEQDLIEVFGKKINKTLVTRLRNDFKALATGETGDLENLIASLQSVPDEVRKDVFAAGLSSAVYKSASDKPFLWSDFIKIMDGVESDHVAKTLVYSNLRKEAKQTLGDLARIGRGILAAEKAKPRTGLTGTKLKNMMGRFTDNFFTAANYGASLVPGKAAGGFARFVMGAINNAREPSTRAAGRFLADPAFRDLLKGVTQLGPVNPGLIRQAASSRAFRAFAKHMKIPEPYDRWLTTVVNSTRQMHDSEE